MTDSAVRTRLLEAATLLQQGRLHDVTTIADKILREAPENLDAKHLLGVIAWHEGRYQDSERIIAEVLAIKPSLTMALYNHGGALLKLRRFNEAAIRFDQVLAQRPSFIEALNNHGVALQATDRSEQAILNYDRALELKPDFWDALSNRGRAKRYLGRIADAHRDFQHAHAAEPHRRDVEVNLMLTGLMLCDWQHYASVTEHAEMTLRDNPGVCSVLDSILLLPTTAAQKRYIETEAARQYPAARAQIPSHRHDRLRIAYVSSDFREHAISYLIAGVLDAHDRQRFEITAIAIGPPSTDAMRQRIAASVEHFIDARTLTDAEVTALMREQEIDIAVDLNGHTRRMRMGIFAAGAAPIQVSFLGFPGTAGAGFMDYVLADRHVIPESEREDFTESVIYLPDTYQPNDSKRAISPHVPSRRDLGLPENGIVFCCFHQTQKITPVMFGLWMRLLKAAQGSVLWLLSDLPETMDNLRRESLANDVEPERLVFAERVLIADHLARLSRADLFLDTLPYNAHTTASDALWAGVPVVTCTGASFAGRVATSLLHAVGLPELVTNSLDDYERLAKALATDSQRLADLQRRLRSLRQSAPLFNTTRFTRHLEAAYTTMAANSAASARGSRRL